MFYYVRCPGAKYTACIGTCQTEEIVALTSNFKQRTVSASKICPTFISLTLYAKLTNSLYRIVKQAYLGFH